MESFKLSIILPASPEELYKAWLSSKQHGAFTGAKATVSAKVNGKFRAWDGYISGKNRELIADKKIVQAWRTSEFNQDAPDSIVEITFEPKGKKTKINLYHNNLQKGDAKKYKDGWKKYYFEPMKKYFKE